MSIANFDQNANATILSYRNVLTLPNGFEALDPLRSVGQQWVAQVNAIAQDTKAERLAAVLLERTSQSMFRAAALTHSAAIVHKREFEQADARLRIPAESIVLTHAVERRARFHGLKPGDELKAVLSTDLTDAAALYVHGNLADLTDEAWSRLEDHYLVLNTIERTGMGAQYAAKATLADPLRTGVDHEAARRAAEVVVDSHRERGKMNHTHARAIQDTAVFLGAAFDLSPEDAFARILESV